MEIPGEKIWFHNLNLTTEEKNLIGRIRTEHTNTKERRYKWGWELSDECDMCEIKEDLEHLLYDCPSSTPKDQNTRFLNTTNHYAPSSKKATKQT